VKEAEFLADSEVLSKLIAAFERANPESRERLLETLSTYFSLGVSPKREASLNVISQLGSRAALPSFTEDRSLSAKEFLAQKQPRTDMEKVACLAYYLTHYRSTPQFKTVDISRLNTDAAQIKLSNATVAINNASKHGYLAPAGKGFKQITALGEDYVAALPDRDAAKAVMAAGRRPRRKAKKSKRPS
jgi:hypothetical protein